MADRIEYWKLSSDSIKGLVSVNKALAAVLPARLINLVYLRVSQINGCAYCIDAHTHDALKEGDTQDRLNLLSAWREVPERFTEAEQAALAWSEAMTRMADAGHVQHEAREAAFAEVRKHFDETQTSNLGVAIATINAFNRIAVGFHKSVPVRGSA